MLMKTFVCWFGCPLAIHSNNGREFINMLMTALLTRLEVKHMNNPVANPQSNNVERFQRTLGPTSVCGQSGRAWTG